MADTGNGAKLTLTAGAWTTTTVLDIVSISPGSESVESLDVTTLASTGYKEYIPGDLKESPEITAEILFDSKIGLPEAGTTHVVTITWPDQDIATATTGATLVGKGFVMSTEYPELVSDTVQRSNITIKLSDGIVSTNTTAITFTKES